MTVRPPSRTSRPDTVGSLSVSARRLTAGAGRDDVAGDLHGALDTPFGTRLLIGDVMGKGREGARTAAAVLETWTRLAPRERSLEALAVRLHSVVVHSAEPDRFVTAALLTIAPDGGADLVCCGHPPPLLIRDGGAVPAAVPAPAPPLGLLDLAHGWCAAQPVPARSWERMLLHTDGVTEARDADGVFYPLAERAAELSGRPLAVFTAALAADLLHHARGNLQDDASLLAVEAAPALMRA
ncbi:MULTISPECIES: PP2C family protein-serine/threonine phosphatase [unclassified Streptomyces]|uniref:PP2C family protein-serine/threonine phosphatase n=1 Tax=unclassified Streptomyces TaxID=2593676 RepID=UPI000DB9118E|nr:MULTISPECIES: PP2C family protein-serine/threonine phosphatase [unclassified Streptomyces]MYT68943.1 SpoIIE family protein phosphatase [Streptomyces sp. SID8367]RAJ82450.1 stage II sporulation protein E [Streptomyces sp. PsTaAH-137]